MLLPSSQRAQPSFHLQERVRAGAAPRGKPSALRTILVVRRGGGRRLFYRVTSSLQLFSPLDGRELRDAGAQRVVGSHGLLHHVVQLGEAENRVLELLLCLSRLLKRAVRLREGLFHERDDEPVQALRRRPPGCAHGLLHLDQQRRAPLAVRERLLLLPEVCNSALRLRNRHQRQQLQEENLLGDRWGLRSVSFAPKDMKSLDSGARWKDSTFASSPSSLDPSVTFDGLFSSTRIVAVTSLGLPLVSPFWFFTLTRFPPSISRMVLKSKSSSSEANNVIEQPASDLPKG